MEAGVRTRPRGKVMLILIAELGGLGHFLRPGYLLPATSSYYCKAYITEVEILGVNRGRTW
jgi:hypothetical protein